MSEEKYWLPQDCSRRRHALFWEAWPKRHRWQQGETGSAVLPRPASMTAAGIRGHTVVCLMTVETQAQAQWWEQSCCTGVTHCGVDSPTGGREGNAQQKSMFKDEGLSESS